jgi:hypothetical protein
VPGVRSAEAAAGEDESAHPEDERCTSDRSKRALLRCGASFAAEDSSFGDVELGVSESTVGM